MQWLPLEEGDLYYTSLTFVFVVNHGCSISCFQRRVFFGKVICLFEEKSDISARQMLSAI